MKSMCQRALVWGTLTYENVAPLLGIYDPTANGRGGHVCFVTPYMEQGTLRRWRQKLNPSEVKIRDRVSLISSLQADIK
jgi:hypothetical protein